MRPQLGAQIRRRFLARLGLRWEEEGKEGGSLMSDQRRFFGGGWAMFI